jgi:hypothetical protein
MVFHSPLRVEDHSATEPAVNSPLSFGILPPQILISPPVTPRASDSDRSGSYRSHHVWQSETPQDERREPQT